MTKAYKIENHFLAVRYDKSLQDKVPIFSSALWQKVYKIDNQFLAVRYDKSLQDREPIFSSALWQKFTR